MEGSPKWEVSQSLVIMNIMDVWLSEQFEIYPRNILQFAECGRSQILTSIKDQTMIDRIVTNTSIPGSFVKFYDLDNG